MEFHEEDLDNKFRDYINSHQDEDFLVKLYFDEYEDLDEYEDHPDNDGEIMENLEFKFVHSGVLKIFLNNLPRNFLKGLK